MGVTLNNPIMYVTEKTIRPTIVPQREVAIPACFGKRVIVIAIAFGTINPMNTKIAKIGTVRVNIF